jgi:hypothetical protein
VTIISYTMLEHLRSEMVEFDFKVVIVDESHKLRVRGPASAARALEAAEHSGAPWRRRPVDAVLSCAALLRSMLHLVSVGKRSKAALSVCFKHNSATVAEWHHT